MDDRPLVMHVVFRFDTGGLENGVVNLINHMPAAPFRHAVVALTEVTDFRLRIRTPDVDFFSLQKSPGHGFKLYPQLYRLFRRHRPTIVHTRNLAALEAVIPAWMAGVPVRIHGEHGRDVDDLKGERRRYQRVRRIYRPFVDHYVALSRDLSDYLVAKVRVAPARVSQFCNGVDSARFVPASGGRPPISGCPFTEPHHWIVGTVGRMQAVKNQPSLARAFVRALEVRPALRHALRLVMVGDGPLRAECQQILERAGAADLAWLPGERTDVDATMRGFDCFVLPSLAEGISNTILEAMASGLPVIATDVGGNSELVTHGVTGEIVAVDDTDAMVASLLGLIEDPERAAQMGRAARAEVERRFSLRGMVSSYQKLYEQLLQTKPGRARARLAGH